MEVILEEVCHRDPSMAVIDSEEVAGSLFRPLLEFVVQHDGEPVLVVVANDAVMGAGGVGQDLAWMTWDYHWKRCSSG
jgi:hypothetical protein